MLQKIRVDMCCHSSSAETRFEATVGDTILVLVGAVCAERVLTAIRSVAEVEVTDVSDSEAPSQRVSTADIVALMVGD